MISMSNNLSVTVGKVAEPRFKSKLPYAEARILNCFSMPPSVTCPNYRAGEAENTSFPSASAQLQSSPFN